MDSSHPTIIGDRRGAAAVEFALVVLPFCLMIFGIVEFGRLMWTRTALRETTIASARCMGVRAAECSSGGVADTAKTAIYARERAGRFSISLPETSVVASDGTRCAGIGGFASVTITAEFETVVPLAATLLSGLPLSFTACFPTPA